MQNRGKALTAIFQITGSALSECLFHFISFIVYMSIPFVTQKQSIDKRKSNSYYNQRIESNWA